MIVAYLLIVYRSAKMVLIQIIILKLILIICLASSQKVIFINVTDYGSPTSPVWLTEKQTFSFLIVSDVESVGGIECKCPMGREIKGELKHYDKSLSSNNYYHFSSYFTVSQDMDGEWTCYVYYKKSLRYYYIIIMDVRVDVNECSSSHGSWPCSHDAKCTNTLGSYKCTCLTGYTGNGTYCQDVDECISGHSPWPCSPDENCTNTVGSYECTPLTGYTGNGTYCQDVDGCNMSSSPSSAEANCNNTLSSDECPPLTGYTASDGIRTLILVVIIVVVLIVVAAVVWLIVGLYKIRQKREKAIQSEFNYEPFENTTERPMPHPAQWDNYSVPVNRQNENDTDTYIVPFQERNVEEMYSKPQPKSLRKLLDEIVYAELSFTTVEQIGETPTYGNLSNQTAESNNQIQPKKLIGNPDTPKILPTESPYSEVLPKSMRPNNESSSYVNVIDTQRFVNSDNGEASRDSEYAEPAYCEVGFKK